MKYIRLAMVVCAVSLLLFTQACDRGAENQNGNNNRKAAPVEVKVQTAELGPIQTTIQVTGVVKAAQEAKLGTKVPGRVAKVNVDEGDKVEKDHELVVLEQTDFKLAVQEAEAAVKNARASASVAKVSLEKANRDYERFLKLRNQSAVSEQSFEDVDTAKRVAADKLTLAQAGLAQANARLDSVKQQLSDSIIRAPFSGVVVGKMTNEGEFVGAGGPPLVWLMDLSTVKIDVGIPEENSGKVSVGQSARVTLDAFPGKSFTGEVITVNPRVDANNRSYNVQIQVDNDDPDYFLNSGMFARVTLITGIKDDALIVPSKALVTVEGKRLLYVAEKSVAKERRIVVGAADNGNVEIISGLEPEEQVIIEGNWALTDGQEVTIKGTRG
ncbi:MAG: efflux RND transporter periplasmic adaptor subunit [Candidatus Coatesbacteria bacterium]|nr:efflux RND transporter periplasmic adaptor subunit [Candidatus Coatesbacteria bacterium]